MNNETLKEWLIKQFPHSQVGETNDFVCITVSKEDLFQTMNELKNNASTSFDSLFCETAVDKNDAFELIYHLTSTKYRHNLEIKTIVADRINPEVPSVFPLWKSAELFECEIFDLFGIHFTGHNCRRLFLSDDWIGFPLRKDYNDEVNVVKL